MKYNIKTFYQRLSDRMRNYGKLSQLIFRQSRKIMTKT